VTDARSIATTDGVEVAVHDLGGSGEPLLVLHATGFHGRAYAPLAAGLTDRYRVLALDQRGHGDAVTPAAADLHWSRMADDLLDVIDALDLGPGLRCVGHSMGGAVILSAALTRSGAVRSAWLFEPIVFPDPTEMGIEPASDPLADGARRRRNDFSSRAEARERYAAKPPMAAFTPAALDAYVDHGFVDTDDGVSLKCPGEQEARVYEGNDMSVFARLTAVEAAVHVVGSGDGGPPAQIAPLIADAVPGARFARWDDTTHFAPFEDPGRCAAAIGAALS